MIKSKLSEDSSYFSWKRFLSSKKLFLGSFHIQNRQTKHKKVHLEAKKKKKVNNIIEDRKLNCSHPEADKTMQALIQKGHCPPAVSSQTKGNTSAAAFTASNRYQSSGKRLKRIQAALLCFAREKKPRRKEVLAGIVNQQENKVGGIQPRNVVRC